MASILNPYLSLRGTAKEAMTFYQQVFGGDLAVTTFAEAGMADQYPGEGDQVMHAQLSTPSGYTLMGADTPSSMSLTEGSSISVSLSGDDESELRSYWEGLSDGATIIEQLTQAPWGDHFGMLTDRFGVTWMVNISAPAA